jgi:hypothetical protein
MLCNGNTVQGLVESEAARRRINEPIRIGDACIIEINGRFFLIVEIEFNNSETVVVIRISREQAIELIRDGVRNCPVFTTLPAEIQRRAVELEGVFVVGNQAFLVFETERLRERSERLFVVRIPLIPIIREEV